MFVFLQLDLGSEVTLVIRSFGKDIWLTFVWWTFTVTLSWQVMEELDGASRLFLELLGVYAQLLYQKWSDIK